mgnify:CR=1 FL=1
MTSNLKTRNFSSMTEGELRKQMQSLGERIDTLKQQGVSTVQEELDFCYISRELEDRTSRGKYNQFRY